MMKRQPDGTWRNTRQALTVSDAVRRARWVEAETLRLKRMGLSFDAIAEQIGRVGCGRAQALVEIPAGLTFPPDYTISRQACHKAFKRAIAREPSLELEEFRKLDTERAEEMFMNLQPVIRKGNPRAIEVGVKLLDHTAKIQGYASPQRHELTGKDGQPLTLLQVLKVIGPISDED
ncbi:MAG: hypothetical protein ABSC63_13175 [Candidatus Binataceae bacterium]|jgi:hypothetical protein